MKKILMGFVILNIVLFNIVFRKPNERSTKGEYDCAVVCGYPANIDGTPSAFMKTRADKAISLWKSGKVRYIIFSGAAVGNEFAEAEVMKEYALAQGIPEEVIIEEKKSVSTYHNMMYSNEIMKEHGYSNCIVVTNGWHLRKADHYARKFHLDYAMAKADNPENESTVETIWRYITVNLHMYYMMFKGYY